MVRFSRNDTKREMIDDLGRWLMCRSFIEMFRVGHLHVNIGEHIKVKYKIGGHDFKFDYGKIGKNISDLETVYANLQDFILECWYRFEWDGSPTTCTDIGILMGTSRQAVHKKVSISMSKIRNALDA